MPAGIAIGGNILVDHIKQIGVFPSEGMLSPILSESHALGGCVSNTAISLKRLDPGLRVAASACVGADEWGRYALAQYAEAGIDTRGIHTLPDVPTGYTDVFSTASTRTFFVNNSSNDRYSLEYIDFDALDVRMLHMGYLLLLGHMDSPDEAFGTQMARSLWEAKRRGIYTSIDAVSENSDRFCHIIPAALPYCNAVIFNEIEASRTTGIPVRAADEALLWDNLPALCEALLDFGVEDVVVIHSPEMGIWMDTRREWICVRSLALPQGFIQGSVGAGDAYCAAVLHGIYHKMEPVDILRLANCAAAGCLSRQDANSGVGTVREMLRLGEAYAVQDDLWKGSESSL